MKKIFTSMVLMAAAIVASAQNYTVTAFGDETPLTNGQVITCGWHNPYPEAPMFREYNPELTVTAHKQITIMVTASGHAVDGLNAQICGFGGCKPLLNDEKIFDTKVLQAGQKFDLQLDVTDMAGLELTETLPVTVKISDGQSAEEMVLTINFVGEEQASIKGANIAATSVRVQGRTLHYNSDNAAELTLYTISGQSAISRRISGQGSVNLSALPAGVYIYRAGNKTGKLILR